MSWEINWLTEVYAMTTKISKKWSKMDMQSFRKTLERNSKMTYKSYKMIKILNYHTKIWQLCMQDLLMYLTKCQVNLLIKEQELLLLIRTKLLLEAGNQNLWNWT
jgi:predicted solute-binding protein